MNLNVSESIQFAATLENSKPPHQSLESVGSTCPCKTSCTDTEYRRKYDLIRFQLRALSDELKRVENFRAANAIDRILEGR